MLLRLVVLLSLAVSPALAARHVTVAQLDQLLSLNRGKTDNVVARQIAGLELSERLPASLSVRLDSAAPGPETRQALLVLADLSAFVSPPASAISTRAAPSLAAQHQIISLAAGFAKKTITHLPDFFATRNTLRFEDTPSHFGHSLIIPYQPPHLIDSLQDAVSYRGGREVINPVLSALRAAGTPVQGLTTAGVFGPLLGTVLVDVAHGNLFWGGWEQGSSGVNAVFRHVIPQKESHYEVNLPGTFRQFTGYHGTFSVDPDTGTIFRLTIQADLAPGNPIRRSDILVDYGSVLIAERSYICPLKSVSVWVAPAVAGDSQLSGGFRNAEIADGSDLQTSLSDVTFVDYHVFRAESRIVSAAEVASPALSPSRTPVGTPAPVTTVGRIPPPQDPVPALSTPEAPAQSQVPLPPRPPEPSPVSAPPPSPLSTASVPTLRVNSRLVYVDVVVRDSRGQVVPGLTQPDFRVTEDGVAQTVTSFRAISEDVPAQSYTPATPVTHARDTSAFSASPTKPDTLNMVLFDLVDTSPLNQTYARHQMLRFLQSLPPKTRITLFILSSGELHTVPNRTGDASSLADAARQLLSRSSPVFQSSNNARKHDDTTGSLPGFATPGGEDTGILTDLASELSTENFQHSQVRSDVVQAALRALDITTAGFTGRKNLFWLAETFPPGGSAVGTPGRTANGFQAFGSDPTSRMAIYPISVLGLESDAIAAEMNGNGVTLGGTLGSPALGAQIDDRRSEQQRLRESMEHIAAQTGGEAFFGTNDLTAALHKALSDGENYYSLAYAPTNRNWNGRFRKIQVKLARRGDSLSYRQGYLALSTPNTTDSGPSRP